MKRQRTLQRALEELTRMDLLKIFFYSYVFIIISLVEFCIYAPEVIPEPIDTNVITMYPLIFFATTPCINTTANHVHANHPF